MTAVPRPIGIGCMRLSTAPDRDETRAIAVIHAALDAGATFLDTADAYCLDESETGHNERLVARALDTWPGDRARCRRRDERGIDATGWGVGSGRPREASDRGM